MRQDLPPVIVLGIGNPIGLTIVRELGEHGIEVHGIGREPSGLGFHSRWLHRGYARPDTPADLIALLNRIADKSGAAFIMTTAMSDALEMRAAADAGAFATLRPLVPSLEKLQLVNDKAAICDIAERLGIDVPTTWQPKVDEELPKGLSFPCILKWRDPELVEDLLKRAGVPLLKAEFVYDADALRAALGRYRGVGQLPMVQSYSPGTGLGQMFVMKDGAAVLRFQHRRLHEWPPEGGTSTLCESVGPDRHAALLDRSEALLREIGWEGPAMVEYRHEAATGRSELMEINGRFWGSLPLAYHAGALFALATYYVMGLEQGMPDLGSYCAGIRCRFMVPETRRLGAVTLHRGGNPDRALRFSPLRESVAYLAGFFDPKGRYYVFQLRDLKPFFVDMAQIAGKSLAVIAARLTGRRKKPTPVPKPFKPV